VDSLKTLDPERPIREAVIQQAGRHGWVQPLPDKNSPQKP
jgi:hypothetical protein